MSITLSAFPTAFLISPEHTKEINITESAQNRASKKLKSLTANLKSLKSVRVLTNLRMGEIPNLMFAIKGVERTGDFTYKFLNKMQIEWKYQDGYCCAILSGKNACKSVPQYAEDFFKTIEKLRGKNARDINSEEFFYYNYQTEYQSADQIIEELNYRGAIDVEKISENEVKAYYNNQKIRYFFDRIDKKFILETEQKISLVNIGLEHSLISNLVIKTSIRQSEIKDFLEQVGYEFNEQTLCTPLKMSSNIIKWELNANGEYNAHLQNMKASNIRGEIEHLFVAMNKKAGRDLRMIEDKTNYTYTYQTNYTDKGVLINTLTEHGARNISENNDCIKCELFGMDMTYAKTDDSGAYTLTIERVTNKDDCKELMSELNDEYGLNIQEITYKKILERIENENMRLECEEVMEDDSIVLTIEI